MRVVVLKVVAKPRELKVVAKPRKPKTFKVSAPPPVQPVVDGFAEPRIRDRHHGNGPRPRLVEIAQRRE